MDVACCYIHSNHRLDHRGKGNPVLPQYYSGAERAKSVLHPDVVNYVKDIFTTKGMLKHKNGRRRNRYQKRSEVIKIDPVTGEKMYPPGHPLHASADVKAVGNNVVSSSSTNHHPDGEQKKTTTAAADSPSPWSIKPTKLRLDWLSGTHEKNSGVKKRKHWSKRDDDYVELPLKIRTEKMTTAASKSVSDEENDDDDMPPSTSKPSTAKERQTEIKTRGKKRANEGKFVCDTVECGYRSKWIGNLKQHCKNASHHASCLSPDKEDCDTGRRNSYLCGNCAGCLKKGDCGECLFCMDKAKFGGPNKLRQRCKERVCKKRRGKRISKAANESEAKKPRRAAPDSDVNVDEDSGVSGLKKMAMKTYARQGSQRRGIVEI